MNTARLPFFTANGLMFHAVDERPKAQTQTILPLVEQALQHCQLQFADLGAIAFSRGPWLV